MLYDFSYNLLFKHKTSRRVFIHHAWYTVVDDTVGIVWNHTENQEFQV